MAMMLNLTRFDDVVELGALSHIKGDLKFIDDNQLTTSRRVIHVVATEWLEPLN